MKTREPTVVEEPKATADEELERDREMLRGIEKDVRKLINRLRWLQTDMGIFSARLRMRAEGDQ